MIIGGLDPGNSGAVGVYDGAAEALVGVIDLPGFRQIINKTPRLRVDEDQLYEICVALKTMFDMRLLVIEDVMGLPKQSAPAAFQFGDTYGMIRTTARYAGLQLHRASPAVWKLQERVPRKEEAICKKADAEFPEHKALWWGARGGPKHDRAEAAFLARYGWRKIWPALQPRKKLRQAIKELTEKK